MDWQVTVEPVVERSADHTSDLPAAKTFPPGADQIVFGRESTADVVFPGRIVGGMHGRLYRQPSGEYAIEAYGKHYIEVNGYPADRGQYVPDGAIVRFGNKTGPAVRVRLKRGPRTDGLLSTLTQASVVPVGRALARMRTTIGIVIVAVAVIAAGVAWLYWTRPTLETELAELRGRIDQQAKARVGDVELLVPRGGLCGHSGGRRRKAGGEGHGLGLQTRNAGDQRPCRRPVRSAQAGHPAVA